MFTTVTDTYNYKLHKTTLQQHILKSKTLQQLAIEYGISTKTMAKRINQVKYPFIKELRKRIYYPAEVAAIKSALG